MGILGLITELTERQTALEYLQTVLRYVTGGTDRLTKEELHEVIEGVFSEGGQIMPTIAEQWIQQGFEEGIKEGHQTTSDMLHKILISRFQGKVKPWTYQKYFAQMSLKELDQLSEVALTAKTLTDFETALESVWRKRKPKV